MHVSRSWLSSASEVVGKIHASADEDEGKRKHGTASLVLCRALYCCVVGLVTSQLTPTILLSNSWDRLFTGPLIMNPRASRLAIMSNLGLISTTTAHVYFGPNSTITHPIHFTFRLESECALDGVYYQVLPSCYAFMLAASSIRRSPGKRGENGSDAYSNTVHSVCSLRVLGG